MTKLNWLLWFLMLKGKLRKKTDQHASESDVILLIRLSFSVAERIHLTDITAFDHCLAGYLHSLNSD